MDLSLAASFFDSTPVYDTGGVQLLLAQLDLYDDSKRDGVGVDRRILAVDPTLVGLLPASGVIVVSGITWVMGEHQPDWFQDAEIRRKVIIQRADEAVQWGQAEHLLSGTGLQPQPAGAVWTKEAKYESVTDAVRNFYTLYLPSNFAGLQPDDFLLLRGQPYRVRSHYLTAGGFTAVEALQLTDDALRTVTYNSRTFDGAAGGYTTTPLAGVPALVLEFYEDYTVTRPDVSFDKGDKQVRVEKAVVASPKPGDTVEGVGTVAGVTDCGGTWLLKVCP